MGNTLMCPDSGTDSPLSFVEPSEQRVVVVDGPDAVVDLFETDVVALERIAEELLLELQPEGAVVADTADQEVTRVLRRGNPVGQRPR